MCDIECNILNMRLESWIISSNMVYLMQLLTEVRKILEFLKGVLVQKQCPCIHCYTYSLSEYGRPYISIFKQCYDSL